MTGSSLLEMPSEDTLAFNETGSVSVEELKEMVLRLRIDFPNTLETRFILRPDGNICMS